MGKIVLKLKKKNGTTYDISNLSGLSSFNVLSQTNVDPSTISYGPVASNGKFEFVDADNEVSDLIDNDEIENSNTECTAFLNNNSKALATMITTDSSYDNDGSVFSASTTDSISYWQKEEIPVSDSDVDVLKDYDGRSFLSKFFAKAIPSENSFYLSNEYPYNALNQMNILSFLYLAKLNDIDFSEKYTSYELINYYCNLFQLCFFKDYDKSNLGGLYLAQSRPIITNSQYVISSNTDAKNIFVPKRAIIKDYGVEKFVKNKYKQIKIPVVEITKEDGVILSNRGTTASSSGGGGGEGHIGGRSVSNDNSVQTPEQYLDDTAPYKSGEFYKESEVRDKFEFIETYETNNETWYIYRGKVDFFGGEYIKTNNDSDEGYFRMSYKIPNPSFSDNVFVFESNILTLTSHSLFKTAITTNTYSGGEQLTGFYCAFIDENNQKINDYFRKSSTIEIALSYTYIIAYMNLDLGNSSKPFKFWISSGSTNNVHYTKQTRKETTYTITKDGLSDSDIKLNEILELPENPFLTTTSTVQAPSDDLPTYPLYEYIAYNILSDYKNGIRTRNVDVCAIDYYYDNSQTKAITFDNGDVFIAGQHIKIEDDDRTWRITGVDKVYDGEFYYKLELQECLRVESSDPVIAGLYVTEYSGGVPVRSGVLKKSWADLIADGQITLSGTSVTDSDFSSLLSSSVYGYIRLPENITSIGNSAFSGETYLKGVLFNGNITSIGEEAFKNCSSLTSFLVKSDVTTIGANAFYGCSSLTSVTFENTSDWEYNGEPIDVTNASTNASNLKTNKLGEWKRMPAGLYSAQGVLVKTWAQLIEDEDVTVDGTTITGSSTSLAGKLRISDTITQLGYQAFYGCSGLIGVLIPDSVTVIGERAFQGCSGLTIIATPDTTTSVGARAFYNCSGATFIYIGTSVTSIGGSAFYGCSGVDEIDIPNSVTTIGGSAFASCSNATKLTIGTGVTNIGTYAFAYMTKLTTINYNATNCANLSSKNYVFANAGSSGSGVSLTIGSNVTKVPAYLFCPYNLVGYVPKITSVVFEPTSSCEEIGESAFERCTYITSISLPNSLRKLNGFAFNQCTGLTSLTMPSTITSLGSNIFSGCTSLYNDVNNIRYIKTTTSNYFLLSTVLTTTISSAPISNECVYIAPNAFGECTSIPSVSLGSSVVYVGQRAFAGCSNLASVSLSNSLKIIDNYSFIFCTSLTSITVPANVEKMGYSSFERCPLTTAVFNDTTGWKAGNTSLNLSNSSTNATYLTTTYVSYTWTKS